MAKYRAVLMVPSVVEFENWGGERTVTEHVNRIAAGMGRCDSMHPTQAGVIYEPKVIECVKVSRSDAKACA